MYHSLKNFTHLIKQRIPQKVKIVAEIRLMWEDIVGERMAKRSQPIKCEYIPIKDEHEQNTGQFKRRLVVNVYDDVIKTAMTTYSAEYLQRIPNRYYIHSLRFNQGEVSVIEPAYVPKSPVIEIPQEQRNQIIQQVQTLSETLKQPMLEYLVVCKYQQNKQNKNS